MKWTFAMPWALPCRRPKRLENGKRGAGFREDMGRGQCPRVSSDEKMGAETLQCGSGPPVTLIGQPRSSVEMSAGKDPPASDKVR